MTDPLNPEYRYIAYIDESGDDGLRAVKPLDARGSSEWLIVAGVVIDVSREGEVVGWIKDLLAALNSRQLKIIHFRNLDDYKKMIACKHLAKLPVRCFVVASNKKNMRGYHNPNAAQVPSNAWFYCWLTRVLLERITDFVATDSAKRYSAVKRVKLEYSERGGVRYGQMAAYYNWLRDKSRAGNMFITEGDLVWETLHSNLLCSYPHDTRAGLTLPDIAAGAFFQACDVCDSGKCNPELARVLEPRMARNPDTVHGQIAGYGLKLLPSFKTAALRDDQAEIFRYYGYPKQWWAAALSAS